DLPVLKPGESKSVSEYTAGSNDYLLSTGIRKGRDFVTQNITRPHNTNDLEIYSIAIQKWDAQKHRLKYFEIPENLQTHNNKSAFVDRFKVIDGSGLAHTLVAHIA